MSNIIDKMLVYRFDYRHTCEIVENWMIENHGRMFLCKFMLEGIIPDILLIGVEKVFSYTAVTKNS